MQLSHVQRLWNLLVTERKEIIPVYFYAFLNGLVQLAIPLGIQAIIGFVMGASMVTSIYVLIVVIVLAVLLVGIMQIKQMQIIEKIQQKIFTRYAFAFTETIPRIDLVSQGSGFLPEKVNRFFDTIGIQKGLSKLLLDIPTASIQIVFGLLLLALYHPLFIVFGFLLLFILWMILKLTGKNGLRTSMKESSYKYAVVSWLEEMALNIKSFKFTQGTHLNLQKTDSNLLGYLSSRTRHFNVLLFQYWSLVIFKVMITAGMLGVGTYLLIQQQLNIGEFIAAEIVILTVITAVEKLIINLDSVYDVITGLEKLSLVLETPLEKDGNRTFIPGDSGMDIELIDFGFHYPEGRNILENVNISIPANSITYISGHSGAGKSTLLKLLGGYYSDHHHGSLLYDHCPSGQYKLESLRQHISMYLQQDELYKGTILENISLGRKSVTYEKVVQMISRLELEDYFKVLKDNLETGVYQSGNNLSGMMKRIILVLRALVTEPRLLLMEEPPLGMDDRIKGNILRYLFTLKQHSTIFIVSSDQAFARTCDYHIEIHNRNLKLTRNR